MTYDRVEILTSSIPKAVETIFQHAVDTYAGETNKTASVWRQFTDSMLDFRPHQKSSTVSDIMGHQLLSERRFFAEFLASPEPPAGDVLPPRTTVEALTERFIELARPRLDWIAKRTQSDWLEPVRFFDVERERIWVFWRRVLHSAHHRTQLTVYLRMLDRNVPSSYGPTADVTWAGADPTLAPPLQPG